MRHSTFSVGNWLATNSATTSTIAARRSVKSQSVKHRRNRIVVKSSQARSFLVLLLIGLMCYAGSPIQAQINQPPETVAAADAPLQNYAQRLGFYVGAAVNIAPFRNEAQYTDTLKREFNIIVAENVFKFDAVHPAQNTYNFTDTDALVNFAEANGMKIRGHTLVWHGQLPAWVTSGNLG